MRWALRVMLGAAVAQPALAGEAVVTAASAREAGGVWSFDVTVWHEDTGWNHYADKWQIAGPDGAVFGVRELFHPHVDEQPFTRSLTGVNIPAGTGRVVITAHDSVHGWGPPFTLPLRR